MPTRRICLQCKRVLSECQCVDVCARCGFNTRNCQCEDSLRVALYDRENDRYALDEDVEDDLRRDYGSNEEERGPIYWEGYNAVLRRGRRSTIICTRKHPEDRREFYRGVSDARSRFR